MAGQERPGTITEYVRLRSEIAAGGLAGTSVGVSVRRSDVGMPQSVAYQVGRRSTVGSVRGVGVPEPVWGTHWPRCRHGLWRRSLSCGPVRRLKPCCPCARRSRGPRPAHRSGAWSGASRRHCKGEPSCLATLNLPPPRRSSRASSRRSSSWMVSRVVLSVISGSV